MKYQIIIFRCNVCVKSVNIAFNFINNKFGGQLKKNEIDILFKTIKI